MTQFLNAFSFFILFTTSQQIATTFMHPYHEVLCVTFLDVYFRASIRNLKSNMKYARANCSSWAAVSYRANCQSLALKLLEVNKDLLITADSSSTHLFYIFPSNSSNNNQSVSKVFLYQYLLPYLHLYRRVFLLDEDISLEHFDFIQYFAYLNCDSSNSFHPILSQPLIRGHGDILHPYLQHETWTNQNNSVMSEVTVVAVPSSYIGSQAVVIDSKFFAWFIRKVLFKFYNSFENVSHVDGVGFEDTWCKAAKRYSIDKGYVQQNYDYSCIILVMSATSYVSHLNFKTMGKITMEPNDGNTNDYVARWYKEIFPHYVEVEKLGAPLWNTKSLWIHETSSGKCNPFTQLDLPNNSRRVDRLLCITFINLGLDRATFVLKQNMVYGRANCSSWTAVSYIPNSPSLGLTFIEANLDLQLTALSSSTKIFFIFHSSSVGSERTLKTVLYQYLLPHLPYYKRAFLIDEDFSLQYFDFKQYFDFLDCKSGPLAHTLVSQPIIQGRALYPFFQHEYWANQTMVIDGLVAVPSVYVEQQAPVIESQFFSWFIRKILSRFYGVVKNLRNGWVSSSQTSS